MRFSALALALATPATAQTATSPDGRNTITLARDDQGRATWAAARDGIPIIAPSPIALELTDDRIGYGMAVTGNDRAAADARYPIVAGKAAEGRDRHNQLTVHLVETGGAKRRMDVVLRAYDTGVAFRIVLPVQPATAAAIVRGEETEFRFPRAYPCWGFNIGSFGKSHEGEFDPVDTTKLREHNLYDLPFVCETGRAAFALAEADLIDFAGLYFTGRGDGGSGLKAKLSPAIDDPRVAVRTRIGSPVTTPWRVVMLGDSAGKLTESTLITDLSTPSRIADTSWIIPGKSSWDWWNGYAVGGKTDVGTTTASAKAYIDFAADTGLAFAMIDDGWYVGSGKAPLILPGTDLTRATDAFDLPAVVEHARRRGIRLWLWAHWRAVDAQMEEAFALYERLGIAGVKIDFMDRDDQAMVNWYAKVLAAAARHRLMVDFHGAFPPRGLTRTYPNYMTQEGVMGAEYNKWSARVTADHNVMLAYTRGLLGAMDYTPGGFRTVGPAAFKVRNALPYVQTTRAHALAMYVVYESPLAIVADSPDTYATSPAGLDFVRAVPTTWDETRFVAGETGKWIAIARRKGDRWYLGVMNGSEARTVTLPLGFLPGPARATLWRDAASPEKIERTSRSLSPATALTVDLAATGGAAAVIEPSPPG